MQHLPPSHHETSKCNSPSETKIKDKENETIPDSNSNLATSMTHHNQTKKLTTWFLKVNGIELGTHNRVASLSLYMKDYMDKSK
jgi:hypothetical protein